MCGTAWAWGRGRAGGAAEGRDEMLQWRLHQCLEWALIWALDVGVLKAVLWLTASGRMKPSGVVSG